MKQALIIVLSCAISLSAGALGGAMWAKRSADRYIGHWYVTDLMQNGYAAREIYAGRGRQLADHLRDKFPERVLGVEKEFRQDDARNTAFRVVTEAYAESGMAVPPEIRDKFLFRERQIVNKISGPESTDLFASKTDKVDSSFRTLSPTK